MLGARVTFAEGVFPSDGAICGIGVGIVPFDGVAVGTGAVGDCDVLLKMLLSNTGGDVTFKADGFSGTGLDGIVADGEGAGVTLPASEVEFCVPWIT